MKIGIFGDSFAMNNIDNFTDSWVDIIAKNFTVTNWASPGTNLFYSITAFKNNHHKYDKIIFIVTKPGRLFLPNNKIYDNDDDQKVASISMAEFLLNKTLNEPNTYKKEIKLKIYNAAIDYFIYIQDDGYERYVHNLMVNDICNVRPDVILIPTVIDSLDNYQGDSMVDITVKENTAWNYTASLDDNDIRNCHMTNENNKIFASKVMEWLNGKSVDININDFMTPSNREFYIRKIN